MTLFYLLLVLCAAAVVGRRTRGEAGAERLAAGAAGSSGEARASSADTAAAPLAVDPPMVLDCSNAITAPDTTWLVKKYASSIFTMSPFGADRILKMVVCIYKGPYDTKRAFPIGENEAGVTMAVAGPALPPVQVMLLLNFAAPRATGGAEVFKGGFAIGNAGHQVARDGVTLKVKGFRLDSKAATDSPLGQVRVLVKRASSVLKVKFTTPTSHGMQPRDQADLVLKYAQTYGQPWITYVCSKSERLERGGGRIRVCAGRVRGMCCSGAHLPLCLPSPNHRAPMFFFLSFFQPATLAAALLPRLLQRRLSCQSARKIGCKCDLALTRWIRGPRPLSTRFSTRQSVSGGMTRFESTCATTEPSNSLLMR